MSIRVDILKRLPGNRRRLIEVKSSARVDVKHIPDVAIQKYVVEQCGYKVADACLMHLNREYICDGKNYNLKKLFTLHQLNKEIRLFSRELPAHLAAQWKVLALRKAPDVAYGTRCNTPFVCEFYAFCHREVPDDWVGDLPGIGRKLDELIAMAIESVRHIPEHFPLNALQKRACECIKKNKNYYDSNLKTALSKLTGKEGQSKDDPQKCLPSDIADPIFRSFCLIHDLASHVGFSFMDSSCVISVFLKRRGQRICARFKFAVDSAEIKNCA